MVCTAALWDLDIDLAYYHDFQTTGVEIEPLPREIVAIPLCLVDIALVDEISSWYTCSDLSWSTNSPVNGLPLQVALSLTIFIISFVRSTTIHCTFCNTLLSVPTLPGLVDDSDTGNERMRHEKGIEIKELNVMKYL